MRSGRSRLRTLLDRVLARGVGPVRATVAGVAGVAAVGLLLGPFQHELTRATQGLALVVPVVVAAVVGGRWSAYIVAGAATLAFSLLIPPVGSPRVRLEQDLVALIVFSVVAVAVSTVVARRIELLGRVEQQRAALLRSVSHDLRTPLSAIRAGSSELLDGAHHDEETRRRMLQLMSDEAERLDRLVTNLLSMSRIEAGALTPRRQAVDLAELVGFCTRRLSRLFTQVPLAVSIPADLPVIQADHTQLEQVLTNLLENAVRHSPRGSEVRLSATAGSGVVAICVADHGPGVDPSETRAIFEPFRSESTGTTTGIGLAICKAIVEAHGGTISVNAPSGGGANFIVTLPTR
jgi:two-component system sensor histidine kinase KdpD